MAAEKVVFHLFLQISLVPTDGELFCFLFSQQFLGQKSSLLLSSGLPPSALSPEASAFHTDGGTCRNKPLAPAHTSTNNSKTDAQTFAPVRLKCVCSAHTNTRVRQRCVKQKKSITFLFQAAA